MADLAIEGFSVGVVPCCNCGSRCVHHGAVDVGFRRREDVHEVRRIVVEPDGSVHDAAPVYEARRQDVAIEMWCESCGYVGRFVIDEWQGGRTATAVAVGSVPVPGIAPWLFGGALAALAGMRLFEGMKRKTTMKMSVMEISLRTIVVQLIGHIERLEAHVDDQNKRLAESMPKSAYDANSKRLDELESANASLVRDNQERRSALAASQERVRELEGRLAAKARAKRR